MRTKERKFLFGLPSWGSALLSAFVTFIFLLVLGSLLGSIFRPYEFIVEAIPYISYALIISIFCFFICKHDPNSFWYVPIICNIFGIISALIEPNFWITDMWILICGGWVLSVIGAISGALIGQKNINALNNSIPKF